MASSPFDFFRRYNKLIFSVMTIIIMLVFVMSSGMAGGDFFNDYLPRLFGGNGRKADAVATIDGHRVTEAELRATRLNQEIAQGFMLEARGRGSNTVFRRAKDSIDRKQVSEEVARDLGPLVEAGVVLANAKPGDRLARMIFDQAVQQGRVPLILARSKLQDAKTPNPADLKLVESIQSVVDYEQSSQKLNYFETPLARQDYGGLIHIQFQRLADEMGIKIPDAAVNAFIASETRGQLEARDAKAIVDEIRRGQPTATDDTIRDAIRTELRVRSAFQAYPYFIAGPASPASVTPYDFLQYYRDALSEVKIGLVAVEVEPFVAKVGEPPAGELKALFETANTREPDPQSDQPGFKLSRKVKAAYVGGSPTLPFYKGLPAVVDAASRVLAGAPGFGSAPDFMAQVAAPEVAAGQPLAEKLSSRRRLDMTDRIRSESFRFSSALDAVPATEAIATSPLTILSLLASAGMPPNAMAALVAEATYRGAVERVELRDRYRTGLPRITALLPAGAASPLAALAATGAILSATQPATLPDSYYAQNFTEELARRRREALFMKDFAALEKRVEEAGKPKDAAKAKDAPAAVEALVAEFVKARPGTVSGRSQEFRDKYVIGQDPGLVALAATAPPVSGAPSSAWEIRLFPDPRGPAGRGTANLFRADWFPTQPSFFEADAAPKYMTWAFAEQQPQAYRDFEKAPAEVKALVARAWKLAKARDLAKKAADELKDELEKLGKANAGRPEQIMRELRDKAGAYKILNGGEAVGMTRLRFNHPTGPQSPGDYSETQLPPGLVESPSAETSRDLVGLRSKPIGTATVTTNAPKSAYLVGLLTRRDERPTDIFVNTAYKNAAGRGLGGDPLYTREARPDVINAERMRLQAVLRAQSKFEIDLEKLKARAKGEAEE